MTNWEFFLTYMEWFGTWIILSWLWSLVFNFKRSR